MTLTPVETVACCSPVTREPLSADQADQAAHVLKAIADPVRLRLLSLVASHEDGEACVCDLNDAFELSQPTISHHLKLLHESGLLHREKRGVWVYYRVNADALGGRRAAARRRHAVTGSPIGTAPAVAEPGHTSGSPRTGPASLTSRAAAEALGTGLLVAAIIGSGIAATRLSPGQPGLQLLQNSTATAAVLVALIVALHPVSAAFNPVITLIERLDGVLTTRTAGVLVAAQVLGGACGAVLANLMFDLPAVTVSTHARATSAGPLLAEVVATFGLVLLVLTTARGGPRRVAFVVAGWIAAAYWFTSSTSFANPAVTLARTLSDTFAGIAPASVPAFVAAQLAGGLLAVGAFRVLHPGRTTDRTAPPTKESA